MVRGEFTKRRRGRTNLVRGIALSAGYEDIRVETDPASDGKTTTVSGLSAQEADRLAEEIRSRLDDDAATVNVNMRPELKIHWLP